MSGRGETTYQTKCLPFTIALTALTGPLPAGNFNTLSGAHPLRALWMLNSSTVPLRRPAYSQLPSGLQHPPMHHGGTPGRMPMRATGSATRRSQMRMVPSMAAEKKVVDDVCAAS